MKSVFAVCLVSAAEIDFGRFAPSPVFHLENVRRVPRQMAGRQRPGDGLLINGGTAANVDQKAAAFHPAERRGAKEMKSL